MWVTRTSHSPGLTAWRRCGIAIKAVNEEHVVEVVTLVLS